MKIEPTLTSKPPRLYCREGFIFDSTCKTRGEGEMEARTHHCTLLLSTVEDEYTSLQIRGLMLVTKSKYLEEIHQKICKPAKKCTLEILGAILVDTLKAQLIVETFPKTDLIQRHTVIFQKNHLTFKVNTLHGH